MYFKDPPYFENVDQPRLCNTGWVSSPIVFISGQVNKRRGDNSFETANKRTSWIDMRNGFFCKNDCLARYFLFLHVIVTFFLIMPRHMSIQLVLFVRSSIPPFRRNQLKSQCYIPESDDRPSFSMPVFPHTIHNQTPHTIHNQTAHTFHDHTPHTGRRSCASAVPDRHITVL